MRPLIIGLLALAASAEAQLSIEVLPVYVEHDGQGPPEGALEEGIIEIREAMGLIGVFATEYEISVLDIDERLDCTPATSYEGTVCTHRRYGQLSHDQLQDLPFTLQYGQQRGYGNYRGRQLLMLLLLPENFSWDGTLFGVNSWWSWNGWDPIDLHYTTTSCATWSVAFTPLLAHELGHCYGLYHCDGTMGPDPNEDGVDYSRDLMCARYLTQHLRPSNAARVRHHFRELAQPLRVDDVPVRGLSAR